MTHPRALAAALVAAFALLATSAAVPAPRALAGDAAPPAAPHRPNVVLIVADDLGYGETGMQGGKDIPTPNIDSIAQAGVRFTQGYVSCPVCAPTRAGLLTGRYGERFGFELNPGSQENASTQFGLPKDQATLAERLKAQGYATGMFGKWHLGYRDDLTPPSRGFDEFYGFLGGAHAYLPAGRGRPAPILRGREPVEAPPYTTDAFAGEAAAFIERNRDHPFFVYLPFNAVHNPLQATDKYLARFPALTEPKRRTFAAMASAMDDGVGLVLATLRRLHLEEDTLVVFLSDNGGPTPQTTSGNGPLRGYKGQVLEGGIRIPFCLQWKGRIPAGATYDAPVISLDVTPTVMAAVGAPVPTDAALDGVNLLPYLRGEAKGRPHAALFWKFGPQSAVRVGDWKLVVRPGEGTLLFHLSDDVGETTDLASRDPQRVVQLEAVWASWDLSNQDARWAKGARGRARAR